MDRIDGCNEREQEYEAVRYRFTCIDDDSCSEEEQIAAIYDYVHAVYGSFGNGSYNEVLEHDEHDQVVAQFGSIASVDRADEYIAHARTVYLTSLRSGVHGRAFCQHSGFFQTFSHSKQDMSVVAIGGAHHCGDEYGNLLAPLERRIASQPGAWLFFIENMNDQVLPPEEVVMLKKIASVLGNTPFDPIVAYYDERVVSDVVKQHPQKISPEHIAVAIVIGLFVDDHIAKHANELEGKDQPSLREAHRRYIMEAVKDGRAKKVITTVAGYFGTQITEAALQRRFESFIQPDSFSTNFIWAHDDLLPRVWRSINQVSLGVAQSKIRELGAKRVFGMVGFEHLPMFEQVF